MNWISDFLSHGGAKLLFFAVIILFHFAKSWSKKTATTSNAAKQQGSVLMNSVPDSPRAPITKAEIQAPAFGQSRNDASPWSENQNPFDSSTQQKL